MCWLHSVVRNSTSIGVCHTFYCCHCRCTATHPSSKLDVFCIAHSGFWFKRLLKRYSHYWTEHLDPEGSTFEGTVVADILLPLSRSVDWCSSKVGNTMKSFCLATVREAWMPLDDPFFLEGSAKLPNLSQTHHTKCEPGECHRDCQWPKYFLKKWCVKRRICSCLRGRFGETNV